MTMRRLLIAAALYASVAGLAQAQVARWLGEFQFTGGTETCSSSKGRTSVYFQPSLDGTNGPNSVFTVFGNYNATNYDLENADFGQRFKKVKVLSIGAAVEPFSEYSVRIRFSSVRPARIRANTPMVEITGQIKAPPWGDPACVRDFTMVLVNENF
jgi:hypothetical protein